MQPTSTKTADVLHIEQGGYTFELSMPTAISAEEQQRVVESVTESLQTIFPAKDSNHSMALFFAGAIFVIFIGIMLAKFNMFRARVQGPGDGHAGQTIAEPIAEAPAEGAELPKDELVTDPDEHVESESASEPINEAWAYQADTDLDEGPMDLDSD